MGDILAELQNERDAALTENTSQAVFNELEKLQNDETFYLTRWIWELLQNARDSAAEEQKLTIEVTFSDDTMKFRHNGSPFAIKEITHLVYHGSTKRRGGEQLGQFGTGFLTTHLISKLVHVYGHLQTGAYVHPFEFDLSREGDTPEALGLAMTNSWSAFTRSINTAGSAASQSWFSTEYAYPISGERRAAVQKGLSDLRRFSPLILALNPIFEEIRVGDSDRPLNTIRRTAIHNISDDIELVTVNVNVIATPSDDSYIARARNSNVSVAAAIALRNNEYAIDVHSEIPRLFIALPLVGTEDFPFPGVINSEQFQPSVDRDRIYLGTSGNLANKKNQELVEDACALCLQLLIFATAARLRSAASLVFIPELKNERKGLEINWYKTLIREQIIEKARRLPILVSETEEFIRPKDALIPFATAKMTESTVWELAAGLKDLRPRLPAQRDVTTWMRIIQSWCPFLETSADELPEALTLTKLSRRVSDVKTLDGLAKLIGTEDDAIKWLNDFYAALHAAALENLFDDLELLLAQSGSFRKRSALSYDSGIDEKLKNTADTLGIRCRDSLLHERINLATKDFLPTREQSALLKDIVEAVRRSAELKSNDPDFRRANVEVFSWILSHRLLEQFEGFPALTETRDGSDGAFLALTSRQTESDDVPLAPSAVWPSSAIKFEELFPKRFILSADYEKGCPDRALWQDLATRGYVRISPIYVTRDSLQVFLPDSLLPDDEEDETHRTKDDVAVSTIAFLRRKNIGILDSTRKSRVRAALLLRFLLECALDEDREAFTELDSPCTCGQSHRYFHAGWLIYLRTRKWVPIGDDKGDHANAETLVSLLADTNEVRTLTEGNRAKLMHALGVSVSDLLLMSVANSEEERVSLVKSLTVVFEAVGSDAERVKAIAQEIREHPGVVQKIEEEVQKRKRVERNRTLGKAVEDLLRSALAAEQLSVERTGIGSDYEVGNDVLELDSQGMLVEVILQVKTSQSKSYLVEIKASTEFDFKLTPTQAETAVLKNDRFVVCTVALQAIAPTEDEVRKGARFTFDIGTLIQPLWNSYETLRSGVEAATRKVGDIEIVTEDSQTRFRLGKSTWENGQTFEQAVEKFKAG
ncbi:MAG: ATP-binding protein [Terriglobia bacterium]